MNFGRPWGWGASKQKTRARKSASALNGPNGCEGLSNCGRRP